MFKKISLYLNTIKFLKFSQIFYRIFYLFYRPLINENIRLKTNLNTKNWVTPVFKKKSILSKDEFRFLNITKKLNLDSDWTEHHENDLWTYNLHYFDGLIRENSNFDRNLYLIHSWIQKNHVNASKGWDSYPTSLRLVNWIKWMIENEYQEDPLILESIIKQGQWLSKKKEYHLSGNHLLANAKALIFLGLSFEGSLANHWLKEGESIYLDELEEQILDDGGHYERSPMYHSIILEDMLDIFNASNYWQDKLDPSLRKKIVIKINDMTQWLYFMTHPDGEVAYFNDSVVEISSPLKQIIDYSQRLGIDVELQSGFFHLEHSGYLGLSSKNIHAIMDIAPVGPDHQSGHGHADTLSFELSLFDQRFLVNSGVSTYEQSDRRDFERSTKSHNTVEINQCNSSQTWKSFRMGNRALPEILDISKSFPITIKAKHDGYRHLEGSPEHQREWIINEDSLSIEDTITGKENNAISRIYFHPDISIDDDQNFHLPTGQICNFSTSIKSYKINEAEWSRGFGILEKSICIEFELIEGKNLITFKW